MCRAGRVVNKDDMMQSLYDWRADVGQNAIEVYVHRMRKKLLDADVAGSAPCAAWVICLKRTIARPTT